MKTLKENKGREETPLIFPTDKGRESTESETKETFKERSLTLEEKDLAETPNKVEPEENKSPRASKR